MNWKQLLIGTAAASLLAACSSTKPPVAPDMAASQSTTANVMAASPSAAQAPVDPLNDPNGLLAQRSVYFDYNSAVVKDEYQNLVSAHADYLKAHADHKITIQGNTDARGSREYNLGLGQRRAENLKKSMQVLGVPEKQLEAVSFGKEKPKALGDTEADYAMNRRDDIVYDNQ